MTNLTKKPDKSTTRRLAVEASCDPRTIEKILRGEPVKGMARHRALAVLAAAGIRVPEPREDGAGHDSP